MERKKNCFFILMSSKNPEVDCIYQCRTQLCIRVVKVKFKIIAESSRLFVYKSTNQCTYIFEKTSDAICDAADLQAAVKWYFSYFKLDFNRIN